MKIKLLFLLLILLSCRKVDLKPETEIINRILSSKNQIESFKENDKVVCAEQKCLFIAFWDFDGTILKGDSSEGLKIDDREVFKGLVELGIRNGYSKEYKGEEGFNALWKKYRELEETDKVKAYFLLPQIFEGTSEETMLSLSKKHFNEVLKNYYFPSSVKIMGELQKAGIQSFVISASASFFVKASKDTLPLDGTINGVEVEIADGKVTKKEIYPLTYAEGKREKLQQIVAELLKEHKADRIYVLAGFGNSYHTDGPFLKYIAEQKLEAGKPLSVMINGGTPPEEYKGIFHEVKFEIQ